MTPSGCGLAVHTAPIDLGGPGREARISVEAHGNACVLAETSDDLESWVAVDQSEMHVSTCAASWLVRPTSRHARLRIEAFTPQAPSTVRASLEVLPLTQQNPESA